MRRAATLLLTGLVAILLPAGCAPQKPPVLQPVVEQTERTPVILLPGITGSQLRERDGGRVVWGNARNFFWPRDGGYSVVVPVTAGPDRVDPIESFAPVLQFKLLGIFRIEFYGAMVRLMEANGYRVGDLDDPQPGDSFFILDYDWRFGNVHAAAELERALERLRQARGEEVLTVHFIGQSNAGRIVRYFLKYGGASLDDAESGAAVPPARIRADKVILIGTDNGGALGTLDTLHNGRSYLPLLGRKFHPETMFSFESLFETLPLYRDDLFFDEEGRPLAVSLHDAESWQRYGWSVFAAKTARRIDRSGRADLFGVEADRVRYLQGALDRSRRLYALLMRDVEGFGRPRYYYLQNAYLPTGERAMLKRTSDGEWKIVFATEAELKRDPYLLTVAAAPGDGYASLDSQMRVSPQEQAALARPPVYIPAGHRDIIRRPATHRWILEILAEP